MAYKSNKSKSHKYDYLLEIWLPHNGGYEYFDYIDVDENYRFYPYGAGRHNEVLSMVLDDMGYNWDDLLLKKKKVKSKIKYRNDKKRKSGLEKWRSKMRWKETKL